MTFSEYMAKYGWRDYTEYCYARGIKPVLDAPIKPQKICRLCTHYEETTQTRTTTGSTNEQHPRTN